jgi:hypothetical protein
MTTPALGALNEYEAATAASKYQYDNELARAYGPYTYLNHPYFYVEFTTAGTSTGVVIVDGISGELTDMETARKISYTHNMIGEIDADYIRLMSQESTNYKTSIIVMRGQSYEANQLSTSDFLNSSEKQRMRDLSRVLTKMEISMTKAANTMDNQIILNRAALNGNKSYENAVEIMNKHKEFARNTDEVIIAFKECEVITGDSLVTSEMEAYNDELKREEQRLQKNVDWDINSMEARKKSVPGFGILIAIYSVLIGGILIVICSVLIGGILIKRRK